MHKLALTLLLLAGSATAQTFPAQTFPDRPVTLLVGYPPGGNTDLMARALQPELSRALGGAAVVVQNRAGAAGTLGAAEIARARADGHTLLFTSNNPITAQPHLQALQYSMASFRFICMTYDTPQVLIAGPSSPFRDFQGFAALARQPNQALVFATPGQGSTQHLLMAQLLSALGGDGLHVPFTGAGPMVIALRGGQVMAFVESTAVAKSGELPVLATFSGARLASLPAAPTLTELGVPLVGSTSGGILAPQGVPDAVAATLEKACTEAAASPAYLAAAERLNAGAAALGAAAFAAHFGRESEAARATAERLGLVR
jgi:tripartite-type tricarboxylate transporter receptor subunit TctC